MSDAAVLDKAVANQWTDEEIIRRVLAGETAAFEIVMRRYNQRLYRAATAILRNQAEAEDVIQDAYVRAYQHLDQFEGKAQFSTWLTRIAVHEALARRKRQGRFEQLETTDTSERGEGMTLATNKPDPEQQTSAAETRDILERTILSLPEQYRLVLMLRDIEQMSTAETAAALELSEDNVKVRLHRARGLVRKDLYARIGSDAPRAFGFMGARCDRVIKNVLERIGNGEHRPQPSLIGNARD